MEKCKICGKSLTRLQRNRGQDYCSVECRHADSSMPVYCADECVINRQDKQPVICDNCGKEFRKKGQIRETNYCCRECYLTSTKKQPTTCDYCGIEFYPRNKRLHNYCSRDCFIAANKRPPVACDHCGKIFNKSGTITERNYCCEECYHKGRVKSHPTWCQDCKANGHASDIYMAYENRWQEHLCDVCRKIREGKVQQVTCDQCGALFESSKIQDKNYCSDKCKTLSKCVTCNCSYCGESFLKTPFNVSHLYNYCSQECKKAFERVNKTTSITQEKKVYKCLECGILFQSTDFDVSVSGLYCSPNCRGIARRRYDYENKSDD